MELKDKIQIAFDAESEDEEVKKNRVGMMCSLTGADYDKRIWVSCLVPTKDQYLLGKDYKLVKGDREEFVRYLQDNLGSLRELPEIRSIQEFLGNDR